MYLNLTIAILNILLCLYFFVYFLKRRRIFCVIWFLMLYFAVFFIDVAISDEMIIKRGFDGYSFKVNEQYLQNSIFYVFIFNIIFASVILVFNAIFNNKITFFELLDNLNYKTLSYILLSYWVVGGFFYVLQASNQNYRDYVEGSSWSIVFLWASSPLVSLYAMQKKMILSLLICIPFIYCAVRLDVRSFVLLSIVPFFVIYFFQILNSKNLKTIKYKILLYGFCSISILVGISVYISLSKNGVISFPDSNMPFGVSHVMAAADKYKAFTGFDGLLLYGWNFINPFMKLFSVPKLEIDDNPVIIARMFEGVPIDWPVYFHFPATLWADAYLSFGWGGLFLAFFWGLVACVWEKVMHKYPNIMILLMPYFVWHYYMLVRGAIAIASVPFAYAFYFSFFAFAASLKFSLLATRNKKLD